MSTVMVDVEPRVLKGPVLFTDFDYLAINGLHSSGSRP